MGKTLVFMSLLQTMQILHLVDSGVIGVAAGAGLQGPCLDNLRKAHQHVARHRMMCALPLPSILANNALIKHKLILN